MFVMAVGATFPVFNSGTCTDAKNLLQCHSLPRWRDGGRENRGSGGEGNPFFFAFDPVDIIVEDTLLWLTAFHPNLETRTHHL